MLKFDLNWIHVVALTVTNFVLGWAWFSPLLFEHPWLRGLGKDPKRKPSKADLAKVPRLMVGAGLSAFLMALGMAVLMASIGAANLMIGLQLGLFAGITLIAAHSLGSTFEGRKLVVVAISAGYGVACLAIDGVILGVWR